MAYIFKIGDRTISHAELFPKLAEYQVIPQLAKEVIIDGAMGEIECTAEEKEIAKQQFCQQQQIQSEEQLQAFAKDQFMTLDQLLVRLERSIKLQKFKEATWGKKVESYFLQRKGQLDQVIYSLLRSQDAGLIQELYFRISEGESTFAELATQYSQGSEAETGGLIGPVELTVPHPTIAKMLTNSQPGQLLPPTRLGDWLVILRLEKLILAQLDGQMRQRLLEEQFRTWLQEQLLSTVSFSYEEENKLVDED